MMTKEKQRAIIPTESTSNARNLGEVKETIERKVLVALDAEEIGKEYGRPMVEVVDARWYMARSGKGDSPIYCSVWIRGRKGNRHYSGYGKAGGFGYCKLSAAFADALDSAGIKLSQYVHGAGMSAVEEAMHAIADELRVGSVRGII